MNNNDNKNRKTTKVKIIIIYYNIKNKLRMMIIMIKKMNRIEIDYLNGYLESKNGLTILLFASLC